MNMTVRPGMGPRWGRPAAGVRFRGKSDAPYNPRNLPWEILEELSIPKPGASKGGGPPLRDAGASASPKIRWEDLSEETRSEIDKEIETALSSEMTEARYGALKQNLRGVIERDVALTSLREAATKRDGVRVRRAGATMAAGVLSAILLVEGARIVSAVRRTTHSNSPHPTEQPLGTEGASGARPNVGSAGRSETNPHWHQGRLFDFSGGRVGTNNPAAMRDAHLLAAAVGYTFSNPEGAPDKAREREWLRILTDSFEQHGQAVSRIQTTAGNPDGRNPVLFAQYLDLKLKHPGQAEAFLEQYAHLAK